MQPHVRVVPFAPSKPSASRGDPSTALRVNAPNVKIQPWAHLGLPAHSAGEEACRTIGCDARAPQHDPH